MYFTGVIKKGDNVRVKGDFHLVYSVYRGKVYIVPYYKRMGKPFTGLDVVCVYDYLDFEVTETITGTYIFQTVPNAKPLWEDKNVF